jgi:hypothetical protein
MTPKILIGLLAVALLAGCATPEVLSPEEQAMMARLEQHAEPPPPVPTGLDRAEIQKIEVEVFTWLLQRPLDIGNEYSAVFLQTDEATAAVLMKQFPAHVPPLKPMWHLEIRSGQSPLDRDTGRPAVILSVDALDPEQGVVEAVGIWSAGDAATGFHTFELKQKNGGWQIDAVK